MHKHFPEGRQLPALERNILKYRAFEMIIFLFRAESLKKLVVGTIRASDKSRLPSGTKDPVSKAFAFLVEDGALTSAESEAIQELIDFRNVIAHRVHELTADVSRDRVAQDFVEYEGPSYLPKALPELTNFEKLVEHRLVSKYIVPLSFDHLLFEAAEKTYQRELRQLSAKIRKQLQVRNRRALNVDGEIKGVDPRVLQLIGPYHPLNVARNGTLTRRANAVCFRLFELGLSDLAVAHLMRVSLRAIKARRRFWLPPSK